MSLESLVIIEVLVIGILLVLTAILSYELLKMHKELQHVQHSSTLRDVDQAKKLAELTSRDALTQAATKRLKQFITQSVEEWERSVGK